MSPLDTLISTIHQDKHQFVLAITGGGASAISALLSQAGASNTLIECLVPYSQSALIDLLNSTPEAAVSAKTARAMAIAAYQRAKQLNTSSEKDVFGLGATAALATDRVRRGQDRIFIAIQNHQQCFEATLVLDKSLSRTQQENIASQLIIESMAQVLGLVEQPSNAAVSITNTQAPEDWQALISGAIKHSRIETSPQLLFPGAFNPPHEGHKRMWQIAEQLWQQTVTLEISTFNVDKPPLDFAEMSQRRTWLQDERLVFTHAPTFIEKARLFPGAGFIVGVDTMTRIADIKYYNNSLEILMKVIEELKDNGHQFLVFGRLIDNQYLSLDQIDLPDSLRQICTGVSEAQFRMDISSSELRAVSDKP